MDPGAARRFTDKEVAIVLRKASELEDRAGEGGGSGLSLQDLEEIAAEVGISRDAIGKAVAHLDSRARRRNPLAGGPLTRRAIRVVPGEMDEASMARVIRHVDSSTDAVGSVTEALGSTRWTSADRFRALQVSLTPERGETTVQVVERTAARLRRLAHLVPASLGAALTAGSIGALNPSSGTVAALIAMGFAAGGFLGRLGWGWLSARSGERVERLATQLEREAAAEHERADEGDLRSTSTGPP
jgi:hypothetical protein